MLYICEIKFSRQTIGTQIVQEVQQKIDRLKRPKGLSCRPVLIHVNGIDEEIRHQDYFSMIIDFAEMSAE